MRSNFCKEGKFNFSIELAQRLLKSFSQHHVKNLRIFFSCFLKKDDWPKEYAGPRLPTLPYPINFRCTRIKPRFSFVRWIRIRLFVELVTKNISRYNISVRCRDSSISNKFWAHEDETEIFIRSLNPCSFARRNPIKR